MRSTSASKKRRRPAAAGRAASNRRRHRRLRTDRLVRIPVQVFPVLPFVGPSVDGALVNLSIGGMALLLNGVGIPARLARGAKLRVHFRLPGLPLSQCRAVVTHAVTERRSGWLRLGIRFIAAPALLTERIRRMEADDDACDARVNDTGQPRCEVACSFHSLCHKPFRDLTASTGRQFEIALQHASR